MTNNMLNTNIEILGKPYPIRCSESEVASLQQAALYLNQKMSEVQASGKAINLERIAIITALNIAHEFLNSDTQKNNLVNRIHHHVTRLQDKLDQALNRSLQTEFCYSEE